MIIRIVKMTFEPSKVNDFVAIFEASKNKIKNFEGCSHVELLKDISKDNVFFTHSHWLSEGHLNKYRHSELFESTWAKTKILFSEKPEAWSLVNYELKITN